MIILNQFFKIKILQWEPHLHKKEDVEKIASRVAKSKTIQA